MSVQHDFERILGQHSARRVMEIAAAGKHGVLLLCAPGVDAAALALSMQTILPPMTRDDEDILRSIHAQVGLKPSGRRYFRAPRCSATEADLIGGGYAPRPGEVSIAHDCVLYLDQVTDVRAQVLSRLTQVLECGEVRFCRAGKETVFPARPYLVLGADRCLCRFYGVMDKRCSCPADKVAKHLAKLTPILGAVDVMAQIKGIESPRPPPGEPSKDILRRVLAARKMQETRHRGKKVLAGWNSMLDLADLVPMVERETERLLGDALDRLGLSTSDYVKMLRVARTVADLDGCEKIRTIHAAEAVSVVAYRGSSLFGVSS